MSAFDVEHNSSHLDSPEVVVSKNVDSGAVTPLTYRHWRITPRSYLGKGLNYRNDSGDEHEYASWSQCQGLVVNMPDWLLATIRGDSMKYLLEGVDCGALFLVLMVFFLSKSSHYLAPFHPWREYDRKPMLAHVKRRAQSAIACAPRFRGVQNVVVCSWKTERSPIAGSRY